MRNGFRIIDYIYTFYVNAKRSFTPACSCGYFAKLAITSLSRACSITYTPRVFPNSKLAKLAKSLWARRLRNAQSPTLNGSSISAPAPACSCGNQRFPRRLSIVL